MSIDALVFCDCLERGSVRKLPAPEWQVFVHDDGCRECAAADHGAQAAFGHWHETACPHDYGILLHRRLDSGLALQQLREFIGVASERFAHLERLALQLGLNSGVVLSPADLVALRTDLSAVQAVPDWTQLGDAGRQWLAGLEELVDSALQVRKPLVF